MMALRTPRRRISPRTRKRYRAIKEFFKRAVGSSSQPDIEINSSIAVNVTDLKHKIVGLEQQLSEVSRTCRELIYLEGSRQGSQSLVSHQPRLTDEHRDDLSLSGEPTALETKIIFKTSKSKESLYRKSEGSESTHKLDIQINECNKNKKMNDCIANISKSKVKYSDTDHYHRKPKTPLVYENSVTSYSASNIQSPTGLREVRHHSPGYSVNDRRTDNTERNAHRNRKYEFCDEQLKRIVPERYERYAEDRAVKHSRNRKSKDRTDKLDHEFIADIIKKQYKPVKLFGRRVSDLSQFTEPMCRDREFTLKENTREDVELCSCCCGGGSHLSPKHARHLDTSDARSICDTRLYSSKKNPRFKYHRVHADACNNSELYDLIPVKERSSPKTRRKIARDNLANFNAYREVPPSPRTHKPRLNLKAQYYTESDDYVDFFRHGDRRVSPQMQRKYQDPIGTYENYHPSQKLHTRKNKQKQDLLSKQERVHQEITTTSSLQHPQNVYNDQNNTTIDTGLNKTQDTVSSTEKTDRALSEIKDILQTFLQEIKKEASSCCKSDVSAKVTENCVNNQNSTQTKANIPNSGHSLNNYSAPQCSSAPAPYIQPYPNTCCYPIMPMCPMSCVQNPYLMPSQSFTCCACVNKTDDSSGNKNKTNNIAENETFASETEELIKEIYKLVAQSPNLSRKQDDTQTRNNHSGDNRILTSRSAGRSFHITRQDATVGTPKMQCYSKSCEAIGSRMISDTYYSGTDAMYSDTILENLSLEVTATTSSETALSTERSEKAMVKNTKFAKVLRSIGLLKKKKKDTIEEQSESESIIDVEIQKRPPFQQDITNYMMHGQEYHVPPPAPHDYRPSNYQHDNLPPYNPPKQTYFPPEYQNPRLQQPIQDLPPPHYYPGQYPPAPPNANSYGNYNHMQQSVPLCLKEIEVKSMGTQSERKISFFRKIKQKMQPASAEQVRADGAKNCSTQTAQNKLGFWKSIQANAKTMQANAKNSKDDPMAFPFKTQMNLREGDKTMRNAMIKKLFHKRNPFSPRNLLIKTLLGKDEPPQYVPKMYRPRMLL